MKRSFRWVISGLLGAAFILLLGAVHKERKGRICEEISIEVEMDEGIYFIHKTDIREFLDKRGDSLLGKELGSIALHSLEEEVERIPQVKSADVFHRLDGTLSLKVHQRKPIARFLLAEGKSFYWDERGKRMPLSPNYTARVPVVTMNGSSTYSRLSEGKEKECLHALLEEIEEDPFWRDQVQELHFEENGEFVLYPLVGGHLVRFGPLEGAQEKLKKLRTFYRKASEHTSLARYDTLDLRFGDQVVAKKKDHGGT